MIRLGVLKIDFHIPSSRSLKAKRTVLRSLKDRLRKYFNVSVAEVDNQDKWQRATFAVGCVSNDKAHIDATLNKVKNFFEENRDIIIVEHHIEIL